MRRHASSKNSLIANSTFEREKTNTKNCIDNYASSTKIIVWLNIFNSRHDTTWHYRQLNLCFQASTAAALNLVQQ